MAGICWVESSSTHSSVFITHNRRGEGSARLDQLSSSQTFFHFFIEIHFHWSTDEAFIGTIRVLHVFKIFKKIL
jgi:hypothetical protein